MSAKPQPYGDPITLDQLRHIKDRMNWINFEEFCATVYPDRLPVLPVSDENTEFLLTIKNTDLRMRLLKFYKRFQSDFIGFISYCDTAQLQAVLDLINKELSDGNDGE